MTERPVTSEELDKIGNFVAEQFEKGASYVHLHKVPLSNAETGIENIDGEAPSGLIEGEAPAHLPLHERCKNMLRICRNFAILQNETFDPLQGLEIVGERKNTSSMVVEKDHIPFHTEEASMYDPSRIVSYWNAQTLGTPAADVIKILPLRNVIQRSLYIPELRNPHAFVGDNYVYAPVIDRKAKTLRHDPNQAWAKPVNDFFENVSKEEGTTTRVTLRPGDVLFIDNHKALHSADHYKLPHRLTYKLLHYALKADALASVVSEEEMVEEAS
jgi:hypothetical protein